MPGGFCEYVTLADLVDPSVRVLENAIVNAY